MSSAENLCKQIGTRSDPTKRLAWSGSNPFDTQMVFLKDFFEKVDFEINQHHGKFSGGKELILLAVFCLPNIVSSLRKYTGGAELYAHAFMRTHVYAPDFFCGSLFYLCLSLAYYLVCVLQPCVHLLGKGWPLGASVYDTFLCFCLFPTRCPGSGVVLDFIIYLQRKAPDKPLFLLKNTKSCITLLGSNLPGLNQY